MSGTTTLLSLSGDIESFVDDIVSRIPVDRYRRERIRAQCLGHLQEAAAAHRDAGSPPEHAARRAISEFGDPEILADRFRQAEAERAFLHEPSCLASIAAVSAAVGFVWIATAAAAALAGLSSPAGAGSAWADGAARVLRVLAGAAAGVLGHRFAVRWGGNQYRVAPYVALTVLATVAALVVRTETYVASTFPHPRWHTFVTAEVPWETFVYDLDFSGLPEGCNRAIRWASLAWPASPAEALLPAATLLLVWFGGALVLDRVAPRPWRLGTITRAEPRFPVEDGAR